MRRASKIHLTMIEGGRSDSKEAEEEVSQLAPPRQKRLRRPHVVKRRGITLSVIPTSDSEPEFGIALPEEPRRSSKPAVQPQPAQPTVQARPPQAPERSQPPQPKAQPQPAARPVPEPPAWSEKLLTAWQILLAWSSLLFSLLSGQRRILVPLGIGLVGGMLLYGLFSSDEVPTAGVSPATQSSPPARPGRRAAQSVAPQRRAETPAYQYQPPPAGLSYAPSSAAAPSFTTGNGRTPEPIYPASPYDAPADNTRVQNAPRPAPAYRFPERKKAPTQQRIMIPEGAPAYSVVENAPPSALQQPSPWTFQQPYAPAATGGERPWGNVGDPTATQPEVQYPGSLTYPAVPYGY